MRFLMSLRGLSLSAVALAGVLGMLAAQLTPPTEMTRFRNSLIASVGEPTDFDWAANQAPLGFRQESLPAPAPLGSAAEDHREADAVGTMQALVRHLRSLPKRRGPIQSNTLETYRIIREEGRGYCADYTQVFNGLAHAATLPVREWGMSFDRFSGDGHAFSEVYDAESGQWVFVDPMHGFYVRDRATGRPLSVLAFRDRLATGTASASVEVVPIGDAFMFDSAQEAIEYYRAGADQFYLWFGNDVFSYDNHVLVRLLGPVSRPLEQLAAIFFGVHPTIRILPTATNQSEIDALFALRSRTVVLIVIAGVLGLLILVQLVRLIVARRQRGRAA